MTIKSTDYNIYISDEALKCLNHYLKKKLYNGIFLLVDENTQKYCLPLLIADVPQLKLAKIIKIISGEKYKNIHTCLAIWGKLNQLRANRNSLLINLGGGVISDIGGFVASTFKRGIDFVNIPTTLLSMADASVGGKLGVDLNNIKNIIGVFNNPRAVFVEPQFLRTLDKRQFLSGFAEIIKHALISNHKFWEELRSANLDFNLEIRPPADVLKNLIIRTLKIKNQIVMKDPNEAGLRKVLNFGHTIGHAIESYSLEKLQNPLLHGEAIAVGMVCEAYLSYKLAGLSKKELNHITSYIFKIYKPLLREITFDNKTVKTIIQKMFYDKKNTRLTDSHVSEGINFTLLQKIGKPVINQVCKSEKLELISEALDYFRKNFTDHPRIPI